MALKKFVFALLVLGCSGAASADTQAGKVKGFVPFTANGKQIVLFKVEGAAAGGCNFTGRFAIDSSSDYFKMNYAGLLAAYHNQTPVTVQYSQSCNSYGNAWDAAIICFGGITC